MKAPDAFALQLIGVYQRWISPRKGWSCAYRVQHGGVGCSGFARNAIAAHGLCSARPLIRQRFADCKAAARDLRALSSSSHCSDRRKRKRDKCDLSDFCNPCDVSTLCCAADLSGCDCTPCT